MADDSGSTPGTGTIHLPAVGTVNKKWVYAGVAIIAGIVGYAWWQHRGTTAAAPVDTSTGTTDGTTDATQYQNPAPGSNVNTTTSTMPTTNSEWQSKVVADLGNLGYDAAAVLDAVGLYLDSQVLTAAQAQIIRDAWADAGRPPENPSLNIKTAPAGGGTTTTSAAPPQVKDLHFLSGTAGKDRFALAWTPAAGATNYEVHVGNKPIGAGSGYTTYHSSIPSIEITGLKSKTHYYANVIAQNSAGNAPGSNQLTNLETL